MGHTYFFWGKSHPLIPGLTETYLFSPSVNSVQRAAAKFRLADLVGRKNFKYAPVSFKYAGTYVLGILITGVADLLYYGRKIFKYAPVSFKYAGT